MTASDTPLSLPEIAEPLLAWYDANKRDLPWRTDPTPYRVWISEIMLQQTRVEAVKPYFSRFLSALPDVYALAACPPDTLHKLWEGLGYYSRVRNLQRAAELIVRDLGGVIPSDPAALKKLPGIGSYTAGAIAAFAYGVPAPAVDGNVLRVLARLTADGRNILDPCVKRDYEAAVAAALPKDRPGDFGQALIEVGATVCGPNTAPDCSVCPLSPVCRACLDGLTDTLPHKEKKKARRVEPRTVLLVTDGTRYLIHRRPDTGLLASLFEFPALAGHADAAEVESYLTSCGLSPHEIRRCGDAKHIFTHLEWHMISYRVSLAPGSLPSFLPFFLEAGKAPTPSPAGDCFFVTPAEMRDSYPLPSAFSAFRQEIFSEKGIPC